MNKKKALYHESFHTKDLQITYSSDLHYLIEHDGVGWVEGQEFVMFYEGQILIHHPHL